MIEVSEKKAKEALIAATKNTLAEMAFLDVIALDQKTDFETGQLLYIEFSKPIHGRMLLAFPTEMKQEVVENIHATAWEDLSVSEIDDCLLELLNILGGNFLRELHEDNTRVQLSFPHVLFSLEEISDLQNFKEYYFDAEGNSFSVSLSLQEEAE